MRTITKGLVLAITCIMLISSMPVVLAATSLGGTSATTQHGGGLISGDSQVTGANLVQSGESDNDPALASIWAIIQSEVSVPEGKTGDAKVSWNVPASSQSTQSITSTDGSAKLTVTANGVTSASVNKTSTQGVAYSLARIAAGAGGIAGAVNGSAEIFSEGLITGTGKISATAEGLASFEAEANDANNVRTILTSGNVNGVATLDGSNVKGGSIGTFVSPGDYNTAGAGMFLDTAAAEGTGASVSDESVVFLNGNRAFSASAGTTAATASTAGTSAGSASTPTSTAGVGCNGAITTDLTGTVSATARGDTTSSFAMVDVFSEAADGTSADADAFLEVSSMASRTATCCVNGEIALATSQIINAVWDATTTTTPAEGPIWQVCIDGATGMTRDGSTVPTEPGYAAGATSLNRKGTIGSTIVTTQDANVTDGVAGTSSATQLFLSGPAYTPTSSIEDAVGTRFAIDKMDMTASSGLAPGETLATHIVGPDAYLWVTGDNAQTLNGHFATDTYSVWDVTFDPVNTGISTGPTLNVVSAGFPREVTLTYGTTQPIPTV